MIKLIIGPMGSGKTELLLENIERIRFGERSSSLSITSTSISQSITRKENRVLALKPSTDTRSDDIRSRNGKSCKAISINTLKEAVDFISHYSNLQGIKNFAIDEFQMFSNYDIKDIIELAKLAERENLNIIISGLNQTSELKPFSIVADMAMFADEIQVVHGKCSYCGGPSRTTVCKIDKSEEILVGDDIYDQTCFCCRNFVE